MKNLALTLLCLLGFVEIIVGAFLARLLIYADQVPFRHDIGLTVGQYRELNRYLKDFQDLWDVVAWFGLLTLILTGLLIFALRKGTDQESKGICEERARKVDLIVDSNPEALSADNGQAKMNGSFLIMAGALVVGLGFYAFGSLGYLTAIVGAWFIFWGIIGYLESSKGAYYIDKIPILRKCFRKRRSQTRRYS
jgi:hypothetical protein